MLLPGLDSFGLWEPQERQLADRAAPRLAAAKLPRPRSCQQAGAAAAKPGDRAAEARGGRAGTT